MENINKKTDLKRLLIYLALTFGMTWLWFYIVNPEFTHWEDLTPYMQSFIALGMLFPVIAHILTRLITKEGLKMAGRNSALFGISFKDGKWVCYLLAILLPWIICELGNLFEILFCREIFDVGYPKEQGEDYRVFFLLPLAAMVSGIIGSFAAFGEEGGWRGYMMPKLLGLFNKDTDGRERKILPLIIGGIIWGLWHAPLTCIGHNFGTQYPGFPFVGIGLMCVFCILMGILLSFLTEMSGSVWPAVFMHAITNAQPSALIGFMNTEKISPAKAVFAGWGARMIPLLIACVIVLLVWKKKSAKGAASSGIAESLN